MSTDSGFCDERESDDWGEDPKVTSVEPDENESTLVMEEENSESETTVVAAEKPTEPDCEKLQNLGPNLNLEKSSNSRGANVSSAKTSNNSEKQPSSGSINNEGKVQNPTTEGVSGKFSPKSRQIAAETAEIEKQQQNNASWEDLEEEAEKANEPEPVIKFKKHVPVKKSVKSTPAKSPPKKLSKAARFAQKSKLRAISTPNKNETILQENVTFMDRSADISSIPVLSPPKSRKARKPVNEASFQ